MTQISKTEAYRRYSHLTDRELGVPLGWDDAAAWNRFNTALPSKTSREELVAFAEATGHLTWPETYGSTPWEFAFSIGYLLRHPELMPTRRESRSSAAARALL